MYDDVAEQGIAFAAIEFITSDPASVESILSRANRLRKRVSYPIVENAAAPDAELSYRRDREPGRRFRDVLQPAVMTMEFRLVPGIEMEERKRNPIHFKPLGERACITITVGRNERDGKVPRNSVHM